MKIASRVLSIVCSAKLVLTAAIIASVPAHAGLNYDLAGKSVQVAGNPTVYLIGNDGRKHTIADYNTYLACGLDKIALTGVTQTQVDAIDAGEVINSAPLCLQYWKGRTDLSGQMVQVSGNPAVYAIDAKGQKWQFSSMDVLTGCGYSGSSTKLLSQTEMDSIPSIGAITSVANCSGAYLGRNSALAKQAVQVAGDPTIFIVDTTGFKHQVYDMTVYNGCTIAAVKQITATERDAMATGRPLATGAMCLTTKGEGTAGASVSGTIDPIQWLMNQKTNLAGFDTVKTQILSPLVGLFTVTDASGPSLDSGEVFKVAGRFSPPSGGNTDLAKKVTYVLKGIWKIFNLPAGVNIEIGLSYANLEWDLALEIFFTQAFQQTTSFIPANPTGIDPKFAIKSASTILHVKLPAGAPAISSEFAGNFYFKPTTMDPWMALKPVIELEGSVDGPSLTFGGELSGSCGMNISTDTDPAKNCLGVWNLLGLGIAEAAGGVLKVTLDPKASPVAVTGVEAAIAQGKLKGPTSTVEVDGAVLMDVDASPGVGFTIAAGQSIDAAQAQQTVTNGVINTAINKLKITNKKALTIATLIRVLPISKYEPLNGLAKVLESLPAGMLPTGGTVLTVAPTGLKVGHIDFPGPTFQYSGVFEQGGIKQLLNAKLSGDIPKLVAGDFSSALETQFDIGISFANFNDMVKNQIGKVPVLSTITGEIMNGFTFDSATISANPKSGTGSASVKFKAFGQNIDEVVPLNVIFRPDQLVMFVVKQIEYKAADLGKVLLQGLEKAGREMERGGKIAVDGVVTAAYAVDAAFKDFGGLIQGAFTSSANKWEKNRAAFDWQVHDDVWFREKYGIADGWQYLVYWMNPLEKHFQYGWSDWFDPAFYLDWYPDVLAYCDNNVTKYTDQASKGVYWYPTNHADYSLSGTTPPAGCTSDAYCGNKIQKESKYKKYQLFCAMDHWSRNGINEGRIGNKYFNAHYYYFKYPDVAKAYVNNGPGGAIQHYKNYGRAEKRQGAPLAPSYAKNWDGGLGAFMPCRVLYNNKLLIGTWNSNGGVLSIPACQFQTEDGQRGVLPVFEIPAATNMSNDESIVLASPMGTYSSLIAGFDTLNNPIRACVVFVGFGWAQFGYFAPDGINCKYSMTFPGALLGPKTEPGYPVWAMGSSEWVMP